MLSTSEQEVQPETSIYVQCTVQCTLDGWEPSSAWLPHKPKIGKKKHSWLKIKKCPNPFRRFPRMFPLSLAELHSAWERDGGIQASRHSRFIWRPQGPDHYSPPPPRPSPRQCLLPSFLILLHSSSYLILPNED